MSTNPQTCDAPASLRETVLSDPGVILDDPQILEALVAAQDRARGGNVVDMRGLAMSRLEDRLDRLEGTHQSLISAAYDNVSVTRQVHRALLTMIAPLDFDAFLSTLSHEVADVLRLEAVRLVLETADGAAASGNEGLVAMMPPGFVAEWLDVGSRSPGREVVLRQVNHGLDRIYGAKGAAIRSEALMRLDLGPDRLDALLVLGADSAEHFVPGQSTDLLELFGRVCERMLRSWLG